MTYEQEGHRIYNYHRARRFPVLAVLVIMSLGEVGLIWAILAAGVSVSSRVFLIGLFLAAVYMAVRCVVWLRAISGRIELDSSGICVGNPEGHSRMLPWGSIRSVRWHPISLFPHFDLTGVGGRSITIYYSLGNVEEILERIALEATELHPRYHCPLVLRRNVRRELAKTTPLIFPVLAIAIFAWASGATPLAWIAVGFCVFASAIRLVLFYFLPKWIAIDDAGIAVEGFNGRLDLPYSEIEDMRLGFFAQGSQKALPVVMLSPRTGRMLLLGYSGGDPLCLFQLLMRQWSPIRSTQIEAR
jgi:hypothetical protein